MEPKPAHSANNKSKLQEVKTEPEYILKERSIKYSIKDGIFTSLKGGFTESYVMPLAIAMNASSGMLAAFASVPELVASFFQLFAQESLKLFKTRKRLIFLTALLQAFMWLPLIFIPFLGLDFIWLVLAFVTLEKTLGTFQGPIYNSILGDLIDESKRGEFFGKRNKIVNLIGFVSTLAAGFILNHFKNLDNGGTAHYIFFGFAILFIIALISRAIAAYYKSKLYDLPFENKKTNVTFMTFLKNMTKNNYGIFVNFVFFFRLAASISMPFFALYILRDLGMSYIYFTIIIGSGIIASFLTMGMWGKLIDKFGSKAVLTISSILIPLSPLLLVLAIFIKNPVLVIIFLILEESFSGIVWSGFNLSTSSFLFDATEKNERIKYISYYNFLVGVAIFLGATIGGLLIGIVPVWILSAIPTIFLVTGICRSIVVASFLKKVREARMVEIDMPGRSFFYHNFISIIPNVNHIIQIIGVQHKKPVKVEKPVEHHYVDPVKKSERKLYEKKSLEYYRSNALKTLTQTSKDFGAKDDSDKIEKDLEKNKDDIKKITEDIQKRRVREK